MWSRLILLFILPLQCLAGNAIWEEASRELHKGSLHKRYYAINPGSADSTKRWPDKTITYCFKNSAARNALQDVIPLAMRLWHTAGLSADYQMNRGSSSDCQRKADVLTIALGQGLSTTVGKIDPDPTSTDEDMRLGPHADWSAVTSIGFLRLHANIAHELGHAWGLGHEHQIHDTWTGGNFIYSGVPDQITREENPTDPHARTYVTNGLWKFNCANLKDYPKVFNKLADDNPSLDADQVDALMDTICISPGAARKAGFSAMEYLPMPVRGFRHDYDAAGGADKYSIMLYPSQAGGVGPADSYDITDSDVDNDDDGRLPILVYKDERLIRKNIFPSERDLNGIRSIYAIDEKPKNDKLYSDPSSTNNSLFKKLWKGRDDSCGGASGSKTKKIKRAVGEGGRATSMHHWARHAHGGSGRAIM